MSKEATESFTGYVTKYALTVGIIEATLTRVGQRMTTAQYGGLTQYFHGEGRDWHRTLFSAQARAEHMRVRKLASLKASIAKIKNMSFAVAVKK